MVQAYEDTCDRFFDMLDDYSFHALIYEHFLDSMDQFLEKENGRLDEGTYENAFDWLWRWDCELMQHDMMECVQRYIKLKPKCGGRHD